ncbi:hypothetical protein Fcan01_17230 [Folsomia candida]|uniref:Uncharacterized protein n=1 Tax=Folsomia candida TaxID=158441 RepID=A0A226DU76_FOLCA|nr:hypothetical protein Fcan01_17230 [Folsomia candida]
MGKRVIDPLNNTTTSHAKTPYNRYLIIHNPDPIIPPFQRTFAPPPLTQAKPHPNPLRHPTTNEFPAKSVYTGSFCCLPMPATKFIAHITVPSWLIDPTLKDHHSKPFPFLELWLIPKSLKPFFPSRAQGPHTDDQPHFKHPGVTPNFKNLTTNPIERPGATPNFKHLTTNPVEHPGVTPTFKNLTTNPPKQPGVTPTVSYQRYNPTNRSNIMSHSYAIVFTASSPHVPIRRHGDIRRNTPIHTLKRHAAALTALKNN